MTGQPIIHAGAIHLEPAWSVFVRCREALRRQGIEQWDDVHPTRDTVADDVAAGSLYVMYDGSRCQAIVTIDARQVDFTRFDGRVSDRNYAAASNCSSYAAGLT